MRHCGKFSSLGRFSVLGLGFQIVSFGFQYIVGNMAKCQLRFLYCNYA